MHIRATTQGHNTQGQNVPCIKGTSMPSTAAAHCQTPDQQM